MKISREQALHLEKQYGFPEDRLTTEVDRHRTRRALMLNDHPEIKEFFGYDMRTAVVGIVVTFVQIALAYFVGKAMELSQYSSVERWTAFALFTFFIGTLLTHWLAMVVHESTHDLAMPTTKQNKILGLIVNIPCVVPMAMSFQRYHPIHHYALGVLGTDADYPMKWEIDLIGNSRIKKGLWLFFGLFFYAARNIARMIRNKAKPNAWERMNLAIQIISAIGLYWFTGGYGLLYLLLSFYFGMTFHPVSAHFIHEHFMFAPDQETYSYYGPLNHVTFNVGYHVEHHDFDEIPGWRLPEFKRKFEHIYQPMVSHNSWTWVLWHFVWNKDIGLYSRRVRPPKMTVTPELSN